MEPVNVDSEYVKKFMKYHGGFFDTLHQVKIVKVENGLCEAELKVKKEHLNSGKTIHGGFIAAIIDNFNCISLFSHKSCAAIPNVTVDMHITYIKPAKVGDTLMFHSSVIKAGRSMGFVQCEVKNKASGDLICRGSSNLIILRSKF